MAIDSSQFPTQQNTGLVLPSLSNILIIGGITVIFIVIMVLLLKSKKQ